MEKITLRNEYKINPKNIEELKRTTWIREDVVLPAMEITFTAGHTILLRYYDEETLEEDYEIIKKGISGSS